jgi:ribosomal protein S9
MYIENVSGWQGEQQFISKFGLEIRENASLIVSKRRFKEEIGIAFGLSNPREKERKKYGLRSARKREQYSKR